MASGNFGERLKRERELREVTLKEITSATRIGPRFLEALENEDWEKLPGGVFNRGFVRSIARYLGLDEEALLGDYDLAYSAHAAPVEEHSEPIPPSAPRWLPAAIVLGIVLLLAGMIVGGIYAWKHFAARHNAKPSPAASVPAASQLALPQPPASIVPAAAEVPVSSANAAAGVASGPLDLLVSASRDTHLLVLADGKVAFYDVVHAGDNRRFTAKEGFEVTAADSGAVLLELNGRAMPPLGVPGSSGTITLSHQDLRQAPGGNSQP
jgi:cytoskeleton protein RodZ